MVKQSQVDVTEGTDDVSLRPWTESDDLSGWNAVADSKTHGPMGLVIRVKIDAQYSPALARAACEAGVDVTTFVQRAVDDLARSLAERQSK